MRIVFAIAAICLSACSATQQRLVNAAHIASVEAQQQARADAIKSCAQSAQVAECMLGVGLAFASGNISPVPVVSSDLAALTGLVGAVAPVAGAVLQAGYNRDVAINASAAQVAQSGQQWAGITGIVGASVTAQSNTAQAGFGVVRDVATAFSAGSAAQANAAFSALSSGFTMLPGLVPSITAGGDVTQGDGNDLSVRRDTLTSGRDLRNGSPSAIDISQMQLVCTTGNAGNGGSGTVPGAAGSAGAQNQTCMWVPR